MVGLRYYKTRLHKALSLLLAMALLVAGLTGFAQTARADSPHIVTVVAGSGCSVVNNEGAVLSGEYPVQQNADFQFKVTVEDGENARVSVNGKSVTAVDGVYTITNIQKDQIIRVSLAKAKAADGNSGIKKPAHKQKAAQEKQEEPKETEVKEAEQLPITETAQPAAQPTPQPTEQPAAQPAAQPQEQPTIRPTEQPAAQSPAQPSEAEKQPAPPTESSETQGKENAEAAAPQGATDKAENNEKPQLDVSGNKAASHKITLPKNDEKYTISYAEGCDPDSIPQGGRFTFLVKPADAYADVTPVVKANGVVLRGAKKSGAWQYTISCITCDIVITVNDSSWPDPLPLPKSFIVTLPNGAGYAVKDIVGGKDLNNGTYSVEQAGALSFRVEVLKGYDESKLAVSANGNTLTAVNGVYTLSNMQEDIGVVITVPKVSEEIDWHTVSFYTDKGCAVSNVTGGKYLDGGKYAVQHKQDLSFQVRVDKDHRGRELYVTANGSVILPDKHGVYHITRIREDVQVRVGFVKQQRYTVTFPDSSVAKATNIQGGELLDDLRVGVHAGGDVSFEVYVRSSYENTLLTVKANGKEIKQVKGVYTLKDIQEDITVTITLDESLIRFSITDKSTNVNVSGYSKKTPKLHVDTLSSSSDAYKKLSARIDDLRVLGAYDVSLSGSPAVGDVTVTFPVDKAYNGRTVRILRLQSNGKVATYKATVKNGKAVISVSALGKFLLAGVQDPSVILPPKTGDGDMRGAALGWGMVLFVEIAVLGIIRYKRRQEEM